MGAALSDSYLKRWVKNRIIGNSGSSGILTENLIVPVTFIILHFSPSAKSAPNPKLCKSA